MAIRRKTYRFKQGQIIEVEEFLDCNYGSPGEARKKKAKPTQEQMQKVNAFNKRKKCRHKLLEYFNPGDLFITWTYAVQNRPENMEAAMKDFQKAIRHVRREYKKRGRELYWIRNIEQGTKGAWHIHLVVNEIGGSDSIVRAAWQQGGSYIETIRMSGTLYDKDFDKLAAYMTKDEHTAARKKDGSKGKPRIRESSYSTSRNMPLKPPKVDKLMRWKKEVRPKRGFYIAKIREGVNPVTGHMYRRYTMVRDRGSGDKEADHHTYEAVW